MGRNGSPPRFLLVASLISALLVSVVHPLQAETFDMAVSPDVAFRLPAYGTVIRFSETLYCDSWEWDGLNATYVKFDHVKMDGDTLDYFRISAQDANITIEDLMVQRAIKLTAQIPSGALGTIILQVPSIIYGMPAYVKIRDTISLDHYARSQSSTHSSTSAGITTSQPI